MISFKVNKLELAYIQDIVTRIMAGGRARELHKGDKQSIEMDIIATHANGNKLRLGDLLKADEFNFWHDIYGIYHCLDRTNGKLLNNFRPRFSARDE